jgi:glycosyltransferase involved in cell wall biosynthesis
MKPAYRIGLSLGNIGRFDDGLGEVTRALGSGLAARADALRNARGIEFSFHVLPALVGCFGDRVDYLPVRRSQEWWHRSPVNFDVWHTLHQLNRYRPPAGTGLRIATVHDLNYLYFKNAWSRSRDERRLRRLLARSDRVIAISDHTRADLVRRIGCDAPLAVIHNGVRDLVAEPREAVPGLVPGGFLFHLSRMSRSKNVEALLDMAAVWPEMPLVLAGPDALRNAELRAQVEARGLSQVRVLTGISDAQKAWLYAECAGFVFPSLTEGFGLPPLEAMHFGKPVFVSDLTSLPEVCGDAAWYWRDFSPQAMRQVVEQGLLAHAQQGLSAKVRGHALRFSWTAAIDAHLALYLAPLIAANGARAVGGAGSTVR